MSKEKEQYRLIEACQKNNRKAQETLYRQFADEMFTVAMRYVQNYDEASEVLQVAFIKVFRSLHTFNASGSLEGWVRRIVINKALEFLRSKGREANNKSEWIQENDQAVSKLETSFERSDIIQLVNKLPEKAAVVLKLFAVEGFSHQEISEELGISIGTSKSQLNRARALISPLIERHGYSK